MIAQIIEALNGKASNSGGTTPTGTIEITKNGTYDVTDYAEAVVNVSSEITSGLKLKSGSFTLEEDVSEYTVTGLGFKPKLLIVSGGNLGVALGSVRTSHWTINEYLGESIVFCYRNASSITTTSVFSSNYCSTSDDGFTVKQYLSNPIIAGTYNWIAFTDE